MKAVLLIIAGWFLTGCVTANPKSRYQAEAQAGLSELAAHDSQAERVHSLRALPPSIREQLHEVADVGEPFSPGCIGSYPHERFLAAMKTGATFDVALEQGGIVYTWFITRFELDQSGKIIHAIKIESRGSEAQHSAKSANVR